MEILTLCSHEIASFLYGLCEEAYRCLKELPDDDYGGMIVMLIGDPYQLAVVGARMRLYEEHNLFCQAAAQHGRRLFQKVQNVVYLEENMRFAKDPEWGNELKRARLGEWTPKMKEILSSRVVSNIPSDCTHFQNKYTQVISTDNAMRTKVNLQILKCIAGTTRVFKVPARIDPGEHRKASMYRLMDNKTQGLPPIGYFYPGMQVRMKTNQCVEKGVANGVCGRTYHIEWPEDTNFTRIDENGFCCPTREPTNIFVDVLKPPIATKGFRFPGLPPDWPTTVMPIYRERKSFTDGHKMSICQFPIVPGFATTCYGAQGCTYDTVCVANLRPPHYRSPDKHSLYVALSRVRSSKDLILMEKICDEDFEYFCPSKDTNAENARLHALHAQTVGAFRAIVDAV